MRLRAGDPGAEQVPPGIWSAVVTEVGPGQPGEYGPTLLWKFTVQTAAGVMAADSITGQNISPQSKAGKFIAALIGRHLSPGEEFDTVVLVGKACQVIVEAKPDSMFTNITSLAPATQLPGVAQAPSVTLTATQPTQPSTVPGEGGMPF
jgi:hypothetical protein